MKFIYLTLELRRRFPAAKYFVLLDDDTWVHTARLTKLLSDAAEGRHEMEVPVHGSGASTHSRSPLLGCCPVTDG